MIIGHTDFRENFLHFRSEPASAEREHAVPVYERLLRFGVILRRRNEITVRFGSGSDKVVNRFERLQRRGSIEFIRRISTVYVVIFVISRISFGVEFIPKPVEKPVHIVNRKSARKRRNRSAGSVVFDFCRLYGFAQVYKSLNGPRPLALFILAVRIDVIEVRLIVNKTPTRINVARKIGFTVVLSHFDYIAIDRSRRRRRSVFFGRENVVDRLDRPVSYPFDEVIHRMSEEVNIFFFRTGVVHKREHICHKVGIGGNVDFDSRFFIVRRSDVFKPFRA